MVVYRRTNTQNGKVYIGKTTRTVAQRWTNLLAEVKRGSTNPIHNAIRKYGAGSFVTDILYEAKTFEELTAMEIFFIVLHQSHKSENGYNLTLGGDGASPGELNPMWGKTHTDEVKAAQRTRRLGTKQTEKTKKKIGDAVRGEKNGFYGHKHSDQTLAILAEKSREQMLGVKRSVETRRKMKLSALGKKKSQLHRLHISQAKKGKPGHVPSVVGIERIREAKRQWWAAKREASGL